MTKTKKAHEKLNLICQCDRCVRAESGGRSARSAARSRDHDLRLFLDMDEHEAQRVVSLIAVHGVSKVVNGTRHSLGVATLIAYHAGAIRLGNARPRTCVLVRPKGYAEAWCESVDEARKELRSPRHRTAEPPPESSQLEMFS